jgi:hypothetical protein
MTATEAIPDSPQQPTIEREACDLIEEILLMTSASDDSVPLTDYLPDGWVERAIALHERVA